MSNEDTLPGYQFRALYSPLRDCLADENEANAEIALTACRALTYLMEALPRSAMQVVEATPIFLSKLRSITSIEIAEQALTALEMIGRRNARQILLADGIGACLEYIEFFSITSQNKSLAIVSNCCSHISSRNEFKYIREHLPNLINRLRSDDKKTLEHVCAIFSRLVENFHRDALILSEIASEELLQTMQTMIVVQPSLLNTVTFVSIIHMLYLLCAFCPTIAVTLLKMNIAETLVCLLMGPGDNKLPGKKSITYKSAALANHESITIACVQQTNSNQLIARTPQELYEIVSLIGEIMPRLPVDEPLFQIDQLYRSIQAYDSSGTSCVLWHWQDDQGQLRPYSMQDSRLIEHAWAQGEEEVQFIIEGRNYVLNLQQLQQINQDTNQARFIKRVFTGASPDIAEPGSPPPTLSNESTESVPSTAATTTANVADSRADLLRENLELFNTYVQSLFTILYEVYNTSAGPAVKHRCLQSLLRMIYYSSSDLLETILKQQSISSHIASMLASSDDKIVISALQIAEILMKKLPDIFSVYFYREGVVHQIEILIGFGVSASSQVSLARHQPTASSHSELDLVHMNESSLASTLSEPSDDPRMQLFEDDSAPPPPPSLTQRTSMTQVHPKTQSVTSRGSATRRQPTESNPTDSSTARIETRSQRMRVPPASSSSRIKSSARSVLDDMMSMASESSSVPVGRGRPTRGHGPLLFRPTTFDPSPYPSSPSSIRPQLSTPMYVPSSYAQAAPYAYASSAPAAASLFLPTGPPPHATQRSAMTLSSQDKAKLREWIQTQARHFRSNYFGNSSSTSNMALQILNRLVSAVDQLHVSKNHTENVKALRDIAHILAKGDVSPFEMVHSGLITKLFQYLTDDISVPHDRLERLQAFLHVFVTIPHGNPSDDDEKALKEFIVELHQTKLTPEKINQSVLSHLISKLHGCINQLEQFPIRGKRPMCSAPRERSISSSSVAVNDSATSRPVPSSSALRFISTHQLKCSLVRHPQCKTLKQWSGGPVKIDPFAPVTALEKYLLLRGIASGAAVRIRHCLRRRARLQRCFQDDLSETIDDDDDDDDDDSEISNESDVEDVINVLAHSSTMRLEFLINDHLIPTNMSLYQAIRLHSNTVTQRTT